MLVTEASTRSWFLALYLPSPFSWLTALAMTALGLAMLAVAVQTTRPPAARNAARLNVHSTQAFGRFVRSTVDPILHAKRGRTMPTKDDRSPKPARRYRDARTGRFVTKKYAKKNKKTTLKESKTSA